MSSRTEDGPLPDEPIQFEERVAVYRSPFASLDLKIVRNRRGERLEYFFVDVADFCNLIPVTADGQVVFVRQFRIGIDAYTMEVPGGIVDRSDPSPRESALRELSEETGYAPMPGAQVLSLGWSYPNPAVQANRCHFFACGPVEWASPIRNDPDEHTETVLLPIDSIRRRLTEPQLGHALILNAFQFLEFQNTDGREPFEAVLRRLQVPLT